MRAMIMSDFNIVFQRISYCLKKAADKPFLYRKTRFRFKNILKNYNNLEHKYERHPGFQFDVYAHYQMAYHKDNAFTAGAIATCEWCERHCMYEKLICEWCEHCMYKELTNVLCKMPEFLRLLQIYHPETYDEISFIAPWVYLLIKSAHNL